MSVRAAWPRCPPLACALNSPRGARNRSGESPPPQKVERESAGRCRPRRSRPSARRSSASLINVALGMAHQAESPKAIRTPPASITAPSGPEPVGADVRSSFERSAEASSRSRHHGNRTDGVNFISMGSPGTSATRPPARLTATRGVVGGSSSPPSRSDEAAVRCVQPEGLGSGRATNPHGLPVSGDQAVAALQGCRDGQGGHPPSAWPGAPNRRSTCGAGGPGPSTRRAPALLLAACP